VRSIQPADGPSFGNHRCSFGAARKPCVQPPHVDRNPFEAVSVEPAQVRVHKHIRDCGSVGVAQSDARKALTYV